MAHFFSEHKRKLTIAGIAVATTLFIIYLYALFRPGVWHGDTFLYRQNDGSFYGSDVFADYKLTLSNSGNETRISFGVNDTVNTYDILHTPIAISRYYSIEIRKNGTLIFKGETISSDPVMLMNENENLDIHFSASTTSDFFEIPVTEELFPTNAKLVSWALNGTHDIRGNPVMLILLIVFSLLLAVDLAFPLLFYYLKHGLDVTGGEPSDYFLVGQKIGRFFLAIAILVCVVLSLKTH